MNPLILYMFILMAGPVTVKKPPVIVSPPPSPPPSVSIAPAPAPKVFDPRLWAYGYVEPPKIPKTVVSYPVKIIRKVTAPTRYTKPIPY